MRKFNKCAAQGEITVLRIDQLPDDVIEVKPINGKFIIGHSETGHNHVMLAERTRVFEKKNAPEGMRILYAILDAPNDLIHERPYDTHETIHHDAGVYEYRISREYDPYHELARQVAD